MIAIFGPTAVGKTEVGIALAELLRKRGESPLAVSADALQLYHGLEILTGAATPAQRRLLEHRLLGILAVQDSCSAGSYAQLAHAEIDALLAAGRRPIVLGGTGLYLRAALTELQMRPPVAHEVRRRRQDQMRRLGPAALHAQLAKLAPATAAKIDPGDSQRIVRALELIDVGQTPAPARDDQLWSEQMRRPTVLIGLTMDRAQLYERIEQRIAAMLAAGAAAEVARAEQAGASESVRQALGYRELLAGDVEARRRRTRNYAKRQLTWMRKLAGIHTIDMTARTPDDAARQIATLLDAAAAERGGGG